MHYDEFPQFSQLDVHKTYTSVYALQIHATYWVRSSTFIIHCVCKAKQQGDR